MSIQIPLSSLMPTPDNVRVINPAKAEDKSLVAGIRSEGLLQNLVVRAAKKKKNTYEVIAGGRRYAALKFLEAEGSILSDFLVDCIVKDSSFTLVSLQENVLRSAMHPVDEYKAFVKLMDEEGASVDDLKRQFGKPKKEILQRLALGRVTQVVLSAFVKNDLDLEDVMAFTVVDDKEKQAECYAALKLDNRLHPHYIKRWLLGQSVTADSVIGKFVGRAAYTKAGGAISTDLFSTEVYFSDAGLVSDLANKKLAEAACELEKQGWKWVETGASAWNLAYESGLDCLDQDYSADAPKEPVARLRELTTQIDELEESYDWDDDTEEKFDALCEERRVLEKELEPFKEHSAAQKAISGCFVGMTHEGVEIRAGYVRPEDQPTPDNDSSEQDDGFSGSEQGEKDSGFEISQALEADLGAHRQQAAQAAMATSPRLAVDTLHYTLCLQILQEGYFSGRGVLNCSFNVQTSVSSKDDLKQSKSAQDLGSAFERLKTDWLAIDVEADRFKAFCGLSKSDKESLVAYCVARTLQVQSRTSNAPSEVIIDQLAPTFSEYWRPTKENYFGRINAAGLLKQMEGVKGLAWVNVFSDKPKKAIVADLQEWFAADENDERKTWLPPQF